LEIFFLYIKINLKRTLIEQHLIEQNTTWDKQLNDLIYAASHSDQIINSESLMQETHRYAGLFSSRARYAEDALEKAVRQGVKQYVILGAGMDTFAFRRPEIMEHWGVFEVAPTNQEF